MIFRRLATNNVKGNWHRYIAFFLSSTFSVMIFFVYAAFLFHPDVINGTIRAADKVRFGMVLCEYIIVIFSFFFILYSMSAFLKSRKKELGLLQLFGLTNRQIGMMIAYENMIIAVLAIIVGIGFGALFSKLFFMAMAQLLEVESPIRFILAPKALLYTSVGFLVLFMSITLVTLVQSNRLQIVELLRASKKPKSLPKFSPWLVALAIICLASGYGLAAWTTLNTILLTMLPILVLVIVGTYFLFTQASVALLRWLQRTPSVYYRSTHLVTIAQLVFKMKDNVRTLFMVAILSAVILTASGTFYVLYVDMEKQVVEVFPQSYGYAVKGTDRQEAVRPETFLSVVANSGNELVYETQLTGIHTRLEHEKLPEEVRVLLVTEEAYNNVAQQTGKQTVTVADGHAMLIMPYDNAPQLFASGSVVRTTVGERELIVDGQLNGGVISVRFVPGTLLVVDNAAFPSWLEQAKLDDQVDYYGFEVKGWMKDKELADQLTALVPDEQKRMFSTRVTEYAYGKQFSSLTLFIGMFVSVLFFIASGSLLYFKQFTELQDDQAQLRALNRIGVSKQEMRRIINTQIGMIFFVPVAVGCVHAAFAYMTLGNVLRSSVLSYAFVIMGIYIVLQFAYFALTRHAYQKQLGH